MAMLLDRKARVRMGRGQSVEALIEVMVTAQMANALMKVKAKERYARSVVKAAIRRDGWTDAGQRLELSTAERAAWLAANPLED